MTLPRVSGFAAILLACFVPAIFSAEPDPPPAAAAATALELELLAQDPESLAGEVSTLGDAARGAIVFHLPQVGCVKCHRAAMNDRQQEVPPLGPDLAKLRSIAGDEKVTLPHLIEAVLRPSRDIRKGFETLVVATSDGRSLTGTVQAETDRELVLRDPSRPADPIRIDKADILERGASKLSAMPPGLVNEIGGRQAFLDLLKYVEEIVRGGQERAAELEPPANLFAAAPVPAYERDIDHAGLIAAWDRASLLRGEEIYDRVCLNCHGDKDRPGSLPTSLRFAEGKFKHAADPHGMYRTLTHGFGMMLPQSGLVPEQKYDVIHFIREAFLKAHNPSQYVAVDAAYLAALPKGSSRGPKPRKYEPWAAMDYGPSLIHTYETGSNGQNIAYKGIAMRLDAGPGGVARGKAWMIFDHDTLRMAAAWMAPAENPREKTPDDSDEAAPRFIDYRGIQFDGRHGVHPRIVGDVQLANASGPGWADPDSNRFDDDQRVVGRDGRRYGPLPRKWARYRGLYHVGSRTIVSYTVGATDVLEMPGLAEQSTSSEDNSGDDQPPAFTRAFNIGPRPRELVLQVAEHPNPAANLLQTKSGYAMLAVREPDSEVSEQADAKDAIVAGLSHEIPRAQWSAEGGRLCLTLPAGDEPLRFTLWMSRLATADQAAPLARRLVLPTEPPNLQSLIRGGPPRWDVKLSVLGVPGATDGPFALDVLTHPLANPWACQLRFTGLDFLPASGAVPPALVACTWDGDVWQVSGLDDPQLRLTWRRIASGLFQPLGVKVVNNDIYVSCRDQIVILRDLNGDGETDFYECFNNDHQVTEHFHEFAMGLQTDAEGNFYYAKSARHALEAVVPHHGTLLKVRRDGSATDILASGFRAANGVCLNPDGTFIVTDQEGHWNPKNRINWVQPGGFYGNMFGYHDVTDTSDEAMSPPLCWITNAFDRSPAELLWVPRKAWGPLAGSLLNLSYGNGKIFIVPHEDAGDATRGRLMQGGMSPLPIPQVPTGLVRGRFDPRDGHLYACGMFAWAGNQTQPGGLYRVRHTGKPLHVPLKLKATKRGLKITFSGPLDRESAQNVENYSIKTWSLKRTANYGSEHYDEQALKIASATLGDDGCSVFLELPEIAPTWCMEIQWRLESSDGKPVEGLLHNTIHRLGE